MDAGGQVRRVTIFLHVTPLFAVKTIPIKVFGGFPLTLPLALPVFILAFLSLVAFSFLSFALTIARSVNFTFLAFPFAQHRQIHGFNTTTNEVCLCSTIVKQHCSDFSAALHSVRVQVAMVLRSRRCQRKYDKYLDIFVLHFAEPLLELSHVTVPSLDRFGRPDNRFRSFPLQQVLRPYSLSTRDVAVVRCVQCSPHFESTVDFGVLHRHQGTSFTQLC